jgi:ribosomal protein S15P/S13E
MPRGKSASKAAKGAKPSDRRPCRETQGIRSARNKIRKVTKHVQAHPMDIQSADALRRLKEIPRERTL